MKKRILSLLVSCVLLLALTSCSNASTPATPQETPPPPSTVNFSEKPTVYLFGDEHLGADAIPAANYYGSGVANYLSYYIYQLNSGKEVTVTNAGTNGADIKQIKGDISYTFRTAKADLAVLLLSDRDAVKGTDVATYKQLLAETLASMDGKVSHILVVGPFTTSKDSAFKSSFAAYQQAAKEACEGVAAVQYFACQSWIDEWAAKGEITKKVGTFEVLSPDASMKLCAKLIQQTHMTSLNTRKKSEDVKKFNSDFVITFAGDSITDNGRDKEIRKDMYLGNGHVSAFKAYMMAEYGIENAPVVYNTGSSGATSVAMMQSFEKDVHATKPNYLVVMVGINDAYLEWTSNYGNEVQYKTKLTQMMQYYGKNYDKVLIIAPYYLDKPELTDSNRALYVQKYMDAAKSVAEKFDNAVFCDVQSAYDAYLDRIGYTKLNRLSPDKCHITTEGNWILLDAILKALEI